MLRHRLPFIVALAFVLLGTCEAVRAEEVPAETLPAASQRLDRVQGRTGAPDEDGEPPISKPIGQLTTDVLAPSGSVPANAAAKHFEREGRSELDARQFAESLFFWEASNLAHRPLRFEQAYVERYGYHYGLAQPVVSGVQFFGDVAALPLKTVVVPSRRLIYTYGAGRPGSYGTRKLW